MFTSHTAAESPADLHICASRLTLSCSLWIRQSVPCATAAPLAAGVLRARHTRECVFMKKLINDPANVVPETLKGLRRPTPTS